MKHYYCYILECADGTLYTGYTSDLQGRFQVHNEGKGAKYTRSRTPCKLVYYEEFAEKSEAMRREYAIKKRMTRKDKLMLIQGKGNESCEEREFVMASGKEKTNVMRLLEKKKIGYQMHTYNTDKALDGETVAKSLGQNPDKVFKTLVTVGKSKKNYVFVIPVAKELDLKKAAHAVGEKSVEMIKQKELLPLTGYIHGGCSPIGMKKVFPTVIHESAKKQDTIIFSGGKIGYQVEMAPKDLGQIISCSYFDIIVND